MFVYVSLLSLLFSTSGCSLYWLLAIYSLRITWDRGTDRNRRATIHRSHLSLIPLDKLFPGRNDILVYRHPTPDKDDLLPHSQRRPGPDPHWKIPVTEWPAVLRRVEQGESLRTIAQEYTVSHAPLAHSPQRSQKTT